MNSAIERLLTLKVEDLMARDVISIRACDTIRDAASKFAERVISGAPVLDEAGNCVGILSGFDFIRHATAEGDEFERHVLVQDKPDKPFHIEDIEGGTVETYMSRDVQTVSKEMAMLVAARKMCEQHIHRLIVIDEAGHPIGLLSSLDVIAALVAAVDE